MYVTEWHDDLDPLHTGQSEGLSSVAESVAGRAFSVRAAGGALRPGQRRALAYGRAAVPRQGSGEPSLMRQLLGRVQPNSVLLADRLFRKYLVPGPVGESRCAQPVSVSLNPPRSTYRSGLAAGDLPI